MIELENLQEVHQRLVLARRMETACMFARDRKKLDFARTDLLVVAVSAVPDGATLERH